MDQPGGGYKPPVLSELQAAGGSLGKKAAKVASDSRASNGGKRKMAPKTGGPCIACHTTGESKVYNVQVYSCLTDRLVFCSLCMQQHSRKS